MTKLHRLFILTLLFAFVTTSIQGQNSCCDEVTECGSAYTEGAQTAHWSVYIPIAILVAAAIWFGVADRDHSTDSYGSQDALGSIDNSKRNSDVRRLENYGSKRLSNMRGGFCH